MRKYLWGKAIVSNVKTLSSFRFRGPRPPGPPNGALPLYPTGGVNSPQTPRLCRGLRPPKPSTFKISPSTSNLIDSPVIIIVVVIFIAFYIYYYFHEASGSVWWVPGLGLQSRPKVVGTLDLHRVSSFPLINVEKYGIFSNKKGKNHQIIHIESEGRGELVSCSNYFVRDCRYGRQGSWLGCG